MIGHVAAAVRSVHPRTLAARWRARGRARSEVFGDVYSKMMWGGPGGEFYSGEGSNPDNFAEYVTYVARFISYHHVGTVVDLGCGDFAVGSALLEATNGQVRYVGVDIVPELVDSLSGRYGDEGSVVFKCVDAVEQTCPAGDLLLVREVLQHLSNRDIERLIKLNFAQYDRILVTNTQPSSRRSVVNVDTPSGSISRVSVGSRLDLSTHPFNLEGEVVMQTAHSNGRAVIETTLFRRAA